MSADWQPSLRVDDLDFCEDADAGIAARGWSIQLLAEDGFSFGSPEAQIDQVTSWLQAGWLATLNGWDNRQITLPLVMLGTTARDLAKAEQALMLALRVDARRGGFDMTWQPPSTQGDPCVFEVTKAEAPDFTVAAADEMYLQRFYTVTLTALPWVRAIALTTVTIPAPATGSVTSTVIDDGSSAAGWTWNTTGADQSFGPTASDGGVSMSARRTSTPGTIYGAAVKSYGVAVDVTGEPYVRLKFDLMPPGVPGSMTVTATIDTDAGSVSTSTGLVLTNSSLVLWLTLPDGATEVYGNAFSITASNASSPPEFAIWFDDLTAYSAPYGVAQTGRESTRQFEVKGAVSAPGSLQIAGSAALGTGMIYTRPADAAIAPPMLRPKLTTGPSPTADSDTISGARTALATQHEFTLARGEIAPGTHALWAMLRASSTVTRTITWATRYSIGGDTSGDIETATREVPLVANTWTLARLGSFTLPPRNMGPAGSVLIRLIANAATDFDEGWIFDTDRGRLTVAPGLKKRLWIDSPTIQSDGIPGLWTGDDAGKSDVLDVSDDALSNPLHEFAIGLNQVTIVTFGATDAAGSLGYYRRFLAHVVDH